MIRIRKTFIRLITQNHRFQTIKRYSTPVDPKITNIVEEIAKLNLLQASQLVGELKVLFTLTRLN